MELGDRHLKVVRASIGTTQASGLDMGVNETGPGIVVSVAGHCDRERQDNTVVGYGVYESHDSTLNEAEPVPKSKTHDRRTAAVCAIVDAANSVDDQSPLTMILTDKSVLHVLTINSQRDEDKEYIRKRATHTLQMAKAALRCRKAHTTLCAPVTDKPCPGVACAEDLAEVEASKMLSLQQGAQRAQLFALSGIKLSRLTQSLAYKAIRQKKATKVKPQPRTTTNLDEVRDSLEDACRRRPDDRTIWRSLRSVHILCKCRAFMWMTSVDMVFL